MSVTEPAPLAPFVDAVPMPRRLVAAEHHGQLTVRIRAGRHRFHRDLNGHLRVLEAWTS